MNLMWSEMTDEAREEYKAFFLAYHDTVSEALACACAVYNTGLVPGRSLGVHWAPDQASLCAASCSPQGLRDRRAC